MFKQEYSNFPLLQIMRIACFCWLDNFFQVCYLCTSPCHVGLVNVAMDIFKNGLVLINKPIFFAILFSIYLICLYVTYEFQSESTLYSLPECQGTPCSKQAPYLKFKWQQCDSNPQPLSS